IGRVIPCSLPIESFANPILAAIDTLLSCTNIDRTEIEAHDTCTLNKLLCRFAPQGTIVAGGRLILIYSHSFLSSSLHTYNLHLPDVT
ncbi:hypothetical protein ACHAXM_003360, partial [Skeletonema potamos]